MRSGRRFATLVVAGAAACGLDVVGVPLSGPGPADASVSAIASDASDTAAVGVTDASVDHAETVPVDAGADADAGTATPYCDPKDPALVVCFHFNGDVTDSSSHAQKPTTESNLTYATGARGKALSMANNSVLHFADTGAWKGYTKMTLEMWIRPDALPGTGARAGLLDKSGSFGVFVQPGGRVDCVFGGTASTVAATVGAWTHIACVADGTSIKIYKDGALKDTQGGTFGESGSAIAVGGNDPSGDPFLGAIDELRVITRALAAEEIAADAVP